MSKKQDAVERREDARLDALRRRGDIESAEKTDDGRIRIVRKNVPSSLLDKIDAECAKLNKKAKRLGLNAPVAGEEPVEVTVSGVEWKQRDPRLPAEPFHTVTITGPSIPLIKPGYSLVGIVECTDKGLIKPNSAPRLVTRVDRGPDNDARLNEYRDVTKGIGCAHCDKLRYRKRMIVVERQADTKLLAIGTGCANDYVELRESVIDFLATLFEIGETGPREESRPWLFPLKTVIVAALYSYNKQGYVTKRDFRNKQSTASHVEYLLWPPIKSGLDTNASATAWFADAEYLRWEVASKAVEAEAANLGTVADEVILWAENTSPQNDYQHNLKAAFTTETESTQVDEDGNETKIVTRIVSLKTINLAVSGVNAYMKEVEAQKAAVKAAAQAQLPVSGHVGNVGYKLPAFEAKLDVVKVDVDGRFGPYTLIEATIQDGPCIGSKVVWFANRCPLIAGANVAAGDEVTFRVAVVKGHKTYKGTKKTQITRCQVGPKGIVPPSKTPAPKSTAPATNPRSISLPQAAVIEQCIKAGEWDLVFGGKVPQPTDEEITQKDRSDASRDWLDVIFAYYSANGWPDTRKRIKQAEAAATPAVKTVSKTSPDSKITWTDDPEAGTVTAEGTFTKADFPKTFPAEDGQIPAFRWPIKKDTSEEARNQAYKELAEEVYGDARAAQKRDEIELEQEMEAEAFMNVEGDARIMEAETAAEFPEITPLQEFDFGIEE